MLFLTSFWMVQTGAEIAVNIVRLQRKIFDWLPKENILITPIQFP